MLDCLTLKGLGQNLTSGQGQMVAEIGHLAYQSMCLDKTKHNESIPNLPSIFNQDLVAKKKLFVT